MIGAANPNGTKGPYYMNQLQECGPYSIEFGAIVDDDESGVASVTLRLRNAQGQVVSQRAMTQSGNSWSVTVAATSLALGNYLFEFRALDKAGNAAVVAHPSLNFTVYEMCGPSSS